MTRTDTPLLLCQYVYLHIAVFGRYSPACRGKSSSRSMASYHRHNSIGSEDGISVLIHLEFISMTGSSSSSTKQKSVVDQHRKKNKY